MKTITIKLVLLFILFIPIMGCEKYLEENPPSEIALTNVNEENLEGVIIGMYEPYTRSRGRIWESNYLLALTVLEESIRAAQAGPDLIALYDFQNGNRNLFNRAWPTLYEAIGRANLLIQDLEDNTSINENIKQGALGEAYFVRAIGYYTLVRGWGSVPLRLIPTTNSDEIGQPLETSENIYVQIIEDLKLAEINLAPTTNNPGRATSGAAKIVLAEVYLTIGQFEEARNKAEEVINNAGVYGYELVEPYSELFSPTAATNSEDVFSLKFSQLIGLGSFAATIYAPSQGTLARDAGIAARGLGRVGANIESPLVANWDNNDLRKSWNLYDELIIDGQTVSLESFPVDTEFYLGKYRDPAAIEETAAGNDIYLYRYADALLIFAEAENQLNGPTIEAYEAINQIRRRGYGIPISTMDTDVDLPSGLSKTEFDDLIFRERGYEFMLEGKRWYDMKRTGRWETIIPEAGKPVPPTLFFPLPEEEINTNPAIGN